MPYGRYVAEAAVDETDARVTGFDCPEHRAERRPARSGDRRRCRHTWSVGPANRQVLTPAAGRRVRLHPRPRRVTGLAEKPLESGTHDVDDRDRERACVRSTDEVLDGRPPRAHGRPSRRARRSRRARALRQRSRYASVEGLGLAARRSTRVPARCRRASCRDTRPSRCRRGRRRCTSDRLCSASVSARESAMRRYGWQPKPAARCG